MLASIAYRSLLDTSFEAGVYVSRKRQTYKQDVAVFVSLSH